MLIIKNNSEVTITHLNRQWAKYVSAARIANWCEVAVSFLPPPAHPYKIAVVLADDAFVQPLNKHYRGMDKPTNVLSFAGQGEETGDIILAFETIKQEAKAQKKSFARHTCHLIVHGTLHLLGFDHEKEKEARIMEKLETEIVTQLGFPDPYQPIKE